MQRWTLACLATVFLVAIPADATLAQRPRTEAEARAAAERNRAERARKEAETGQPVALIHDYLRATVGPVPVSLGVGPFYQKHVDAMGIPVLASSKVPDIALLVVRDIINTMLSARSDLRASMVARNWRAGVIARYYGEHIFVHEFAHAIHRAIRDVDPAMAQEIRDAYDAYDAAMAANKYEYENERRHYATTNANE